MTYHIGHRSPQRMSTCTNQPAPWCWWGAYPLQHTGQAGRRRHLDRSASRQSSRGAVDDVVGHPQTCSGRWYECGYEQREASVGGRQNSGGELLSRRAEPSGASTCVSWVDQAAQLIDQPRITSDLGSSAPRSKLQTPKLEVASGAPTSCRPFSS